MTKKSIIERCQQILRDTADDTEVPAADLVFLVAVASHHPEYPLWIDKSGDVVGMTTGVNYDHYQTRGFKMRHTNGEVWPWSFHKAITAMTIAQARNFSF